jgi:leucyl-tRNA synthetase
MFMGPIEQSKPWNTTSLEGSFRFVKRIWRLYFDENDKLHSHITDDEPSDAVNRLLHKTIDKITHDTESMQFNTAISQMMIFVNEMTKMDSLPRQAMESFAILLGPYAPHLAEELWDALGHEGGISRVPFPSAEDRWLVEDTLTIPVQVNGKIRAKLEVPADISEETIVEMAKADERVAALLDGKQIRKLLYIPGRMVTIAVS